MQISGGMNAWFPLYLFLFNRKAHHDEIDY